MQIYLQVAFFGGVNYSYFTKIRVIHMSVASIPNSCAKSAALSPQNPTNDTPFPLRLNIFDFIENSNACAVQWGTEIDEMGLSQNCNSNKMKNVYVVRYFRSFFRYDIYRVFTLFEATKETIEKISQSDIRLSNDALLMSCGADNRSYSEMIAVEKHTFKV